MGLWDILTQTFFKISFTTKITAVNSIFLLGSRNEDAKVTVSHRISRNGLNNLTSTCLFGRIGQ